MASETAYRRPAQMVRERYETSREMVQEHPMSAALTVFGLGFGLGVTIGVLLSEGESQRHYDANRLERYGRQLLEALAQVAPDALSRRLS